MLIGVTTSGNVESEDKEEGTSFGSVDGGMFKSAAASFRILIHSSKVGSEASGEDRSVKKSFPGII